MEKKEPRYVLVFMGGMALVLLIHYFVISKSNLHPTVQVFISLILLWMYLTVVALSGKLTF